MTIEVNPGSRRITSGTFGAVQSLTQSTGTIPQHISLGHAVTQITGGTATGRTVNWYVLRATGTGTATSILTDGPAEEGMRKYIYFLGTGEAKLQIASWKSGRVIAGPGWHDTSATDYSSAFVSSTGAPTFTAANQFAELHYLNKTWHLVGGAGTFATATSV